MNINSFNRVSTRLRTMSNGSQTMIKKRCDLTSKERSCGVILGRYLGAALIMQWNTLPAKLQRELFDKAGSMEELLDTASLRGQIAPFLHKHKNNNE